MPQLRYSVATSLDGFIAGPNGEFDWIVVDPDIDFAAMYAAVGSMVNTVQEAQQAQFPVMMFVLAGFFSVFALIKEPNGTMAQVLTYVPMLSPFVTPMRHSISPLPWPVLLGSIAATVLGLLAVVWLAARIYRVGILMYGKRASLREVARWIAAT